MTKPFLSPFRTYRKFIKSKKEVSFQVVLEETDLFIVAEKDLSNITLEYVEKLRASLKGYIALHPNFLTALAPLPLDPKASPLVQEMLKAAQDFKVGPMASVAGAIAEQVARYLVKYSSNVLIENGGDLYLFSTQERIIGLLANPQEGLHLGLKLRTTQFPCAFCTSSGKIGHSLSFGQGDLVGVLSKSGAKADACATFLGNLLRKYEDIPYILKESKKLKNKGIDGVIVQLDSYFGAWGDFEFVEL